MLGRDGYGRIDGLGGSYGVETLTIGRQGTVGGTPEETSTTYELPDPSWEQDWRDLIACIKDGRSPEVSAGDGLAVMQLVDDVYAVAAKSIEPPKLLSPTS